MNTDISKIVLKIINDLPDSSDQKVINFSNLSDIIEGHTPLTYLLKKQRFLNYAISPLSLQELLQNNQLDKVDNLSLIEYYMNNKKSYFYNNNLTFSRENINYLFANTNWKEIRIDYDFFMKLIDSGIFNQLNNENIDLLFDRLDYTDIKLTSELLLNNEKYNHIDNLIERIIDNANLKESMVKKDYQLEQKINDYILSNFELDFIYTEKIIDKTNDKNFTYKAIYNILGKSNKTNYSDEQFKLFFKKLDIENFNQAGQKNIITRIITNNQSLKFNQEDFNYLFSLIKINKLNNFKNHDKQLINYIVKVNKTNQINFNSEQINYLIKNSFADIELFKLICENNFKQNLNVDLDSFLYLIKHSNFNYYQQDFENPILTVIKNKDQLPAEHLDIILEETIKNSVQYMLEKKDNSFINLLIINGEKPILSKKQLRFIIEEMGVIGIEKIIKFIDYANLPTKNEEQYYGKEHFAKEINKIKAIFKNNCFTEEELNKIKENIAGYKTKYVKNYYNVFNKLIILFKNSSIFDIKIKKTNKKEKTNNQAPVKLSDNLYKLEIEQYNNHVEKVKTNIKDRIITEEENLLLNVYPEKIKESISLLAEIKSLNNADKTKEAEKIVIEQIMLANKAMAKYLTDNQENLIVDKLNALRMNHRFINITSKN